MLCNASLKKSTRALSERALPFTKTSEGVVAAIRLIPKAKQNRFSGLMRLDNGAVVLKVSVTVGPEKGMANKALFKLLTKTWGVGMQSLSLIQGKKNRNKLILIAGEPDNLFSELVAWVNTFESHH